MIQQDVVLADIDQLVVAGADHISFGDPDFFNGTRHAVQIVSALHDRHPKITYDVTIKVEHLIKHATLLPVLRDTGCAFVTSAVESVDDNVLAILQKGHTRADFFRVVDLFQRIGLTLSPTFVAFTPWISLAGYRDLLECIANANLIENVASVQLAIRLLVPDGSKLLEVDDMRQFITHFDEAALCYRWAHPDSAVDRLQHEVETCIKDSLQTGRLQAFHNVWTTLQKYVDVPDLPRPTVSCCTREAIPHLSEPWYCCAEPTEQQLKPI